MLKYLKNTLSVPVYTEKPDVQIKRYVLIEKTGGSCEDCVDSVILAIQSYAESLYEASLLNESVKEAMGNIVILDTIGKSKLNTDYNYTDTAKKIYRYQAVYDITY